MYAWNTCAKVKIRHNVWGGEGERRGHIGVNRGVETSGRRGEGRVGEGNCCNKAPAAP